MYFREKNPEHIIFSTPIFTNNEVWSLFFSFLAPPCGMWDPSSATGDWTHAFCSNAWSLNHWTAREVPDLLLSNLSFIFVNWFQTQEGKFIQWPPKTPTLSTQYKNFSCPLSGHGWCLCLTLVVKNVSPNSQLEGLLLRMLFLKFLKTL